MPEPDKITYITDAEHIDFAALVTALVDDSFHNGRTPAELQQSCENSYAVIFAQDGDATIGMARLLSDGVCNAYLVDVWTLSERRRQGIASAMIQQLRDKVPGQHIALFTEHAVDFYTRLGFVREDVGMSTVQGPWLGRFQ